MKKKILIAAALILFLLLTAGGIFMWIRPRFPRYAPPVFTESAKELNNPYTGWYRIHTCSLTDDGSFDPSCIPEQEPGPGLILLQVNLCNFSQSSISETGLQQLNDILETWRSLGKQLIVRFLYDWEGTPAETEPGSLSLILEHMTQIGEVVNRYTDCVYILQGIFAGAWGEMHGSAYTNEEDMRTLINRLASVTDPSVFLAVRTPDQWRAIVRSSSPLPRDTAFDGSLASRLGLFNDGLLGSETDLGTYGTADTAFSSASWGKRSRQAELQFQNELCRYVPNGGEVVIPNPCNDFSAAAGDLSRIHVSYLNSAYDPEVLSKWKAEICTENSPFQGMNGYDYIGRHLGYRYVIRSADFSSGLPWDGSASLAVRIENVGFAGSYRTFEVSLVLQHTLTHKKYTVPVQTDTRFWDPGSTVSVNIPLQIHTLPYGTYNGYLMISDPASGLRISFANEPSEKEPDCYIGSLTLEPFP